MRTILPAKGASGPPLWVSISLLANIRKGAVVAREGSLSLVVKGTATRKQKEGFGTLHWGLSTPSSPCGGDMEGGSVNFRQERKWLSA